MVYAILFGKYWKYGLWFKTMHINFPLFWVCSASLNWIYFVVDRSSATSNSIVLCLYTRFPLRCMVCVNGKLPRLPKSTLVDPPSSFGTTWSNNITYMSKFKVTKLALIKDHSEHREWLIFFKQLKSVGIKMQRQGCQRRVLQNECHSSKQWQLLDWNTLQLWPQ